MTSKQIREKTRSHLHKGEIEDALNLLISALDSVQQRQDHDNALLLKAKWEGIKQEQLKGIISRQEYELAINKIIVGIQTITNDVDKIENIDKGQSAISSRSFNRVWIVVGILCLIGILVWYIACRDWAKRAEAIDPNSPKAELTNGDGPKMKTEALNANGGASPIQESKPAAPVIENKDFKAQNQTPNQKTTLENGKTIANQDLLNGSTQVHEPVAESIEYIKFKIILNASTQNIAILIDGKPADIIDDSNPIIKTIRLKKSNQTHKIEVKQGEKSCEKNNLIINQNQKITMSCAF